MKGLFLVCFVVSISHCSAQTIVDLSPVATSVDSLSSHRHTSQTLEIVAGSAAYAGATYACYRFLDKDIQRVAQCNQNHVVTSFAKAYESVGLGTSSLVITSGVAITSVITKDKKLQKTAILLAGGHLLNDFLTNEFKITFQRHRPNTGDSYNVFDWRGGPKRNTSFISSHTSNVFATATAFATIYGDKKWVPVVAYSAASLVGLCRVYNNAHWASDVMGGAAIGFASVKAVNALYAIGGRKFSFLPQVTNGHYSATLLCSL